MNDLAVHMTDDVLPDDAHLRQWICSFPFSLRAPMGYDPRLCSALVSAFVREVEHSYRLRAKHHLGLTSVRRAHFGALTLIQRADSAIRLDPHPHTLAIDGVYVRDQGRLVFHPLPPPTLEQVHKVALRTAERTEKILERFGIDPAGHMPQEAAVEDPVLSALLDASAHGIDLFSDRFNRPTLRLVGTPPLLPTFSKPPLLAEVRGINVHAQTWVHGHDRAGIERLVRYVARPPVCSMQRPALHPRFRTRPLRAQKALQGRYHRHRPAPLRLPLPTRFPGPATVLQPHAIPRRALCQLQTPTRGRPQPCSWSLVNKSSALDFFTRGRVDATTCPRCSQPLRLVEIATTPEAIRRVMTRAGLAPMPPPPPIPKPPDQVALQI
jgi:hypothetical protein